MSPSSYSLLDDQLYETEDSEPNQQRGFSRTASSSQGTSGPSRTPRPTESSEAQIAQALSALTRRVATLEQIVRNLDAQTAESRSPDMTYVYLALVIVGLGFLYRRLASPNIMVWPDMRAAVPPEGISPMLRPFKYPPASFL